MADTKKEHYVPRCYLESFEDTTKHIWVYDKASMDEPRHQLRINIAFENYFYDIDFNALLSNAVGMVCRGKAKTCKGDRWCYVNNLTKDEKVRYGLEVT